MSGMHVFRFFLLLAGCLLELGAQPTVSGLISPLAEEMGWSPRAVGGLVTFYYPAEGLSWANLSGDFLGWSVMGKPMIRDGDHFKVTIKLDPGKTYEYKFVISSDNVWPNDPYNPEVINDG